MKRRKGDLWWVTPPAALGPGVIVIIIAVIVFSIFLYVQARYLEAILVTTIGIFLLCMVFCDLLGEILGSIRDLNDVLKGREKEDPKKPA
jgi:hypothetical protein